MVRVVAFPTNASSMWVMVQREATQTLQSLSCDASGCRNGRGSFISCSPEASWDGVSQRQSAQDRHIRDEIVSVFGLLQSAICHLRSGNVFLGVFEVFKLDGGQHGPKIMHTLW